MRSLLCNRLLINFQNEPIKGGIKMTVTRTKRFLSIIGAALVAGVLSVPSFSADVSEKETKAQKVDPQTDKERVIESRKEQQQKRKELRDAVKSGASKEELKQRKKGVKEGQKAIVQDKKEIREQKLGSTKDQKEVKQGTKSSKDAASKDSTSKDSK
jgi:hypothetical protein